MIVFLNDSTCEVVGAFVSGFLNATVLLVKLIDGAHDLRVHSLELSAFFLMLSWHFKYQL